MALIDDHQVGVKMVAVGKGENARNLNLSFRICSRVLCLNNAMRNFELVKAPGALINKLFSVRPEHASLALRLGAFDHEGGDRCFTASCGRDEDNAPLALRDKISKVRDRPRLIWAKLDHGYVAGCGAAGRPVLKFVAFGRFLTLRAQEAGPESFPGWNALIADRR